MATERQVEANRRNAMRSTGPRTLAGKERSRYNAVTHGLRARGLDLLPHEDPALFQDRIDAWFDDYRPMNQAEAELVRHAAVLSWKIDRAERHEAAALSRRVREGVEAAKDALEGRVGEATRALVPSREAFLDIDHDWPDAAPLVETLRRTAGGCRWLIAQWRKLRDCIRYDYKFLPEYEGMAIRMMGCGPYRIADPDAVGLMVSSRRLSRPGFEAEFLRTGMADGLPGMIFADAPLAAAIARPSTGYEDERARLLEIFDRMITDLDRQARERDRDGGLGDDEFAEAADVASFDPSPEGERLRRYISSLRREFARTLEAIDRLRHREARLERELAKLGQEAEYVHADTNMMTAPVDPIGADGADGRADDGGGLGGPGSGSPRLADVPGNGANEADPDPENGASEANLDESVQVLFGDVQEGAAEEPAEPPPTPFRRPRTMAKRTRAAARLLKQARSGR